MNKRKSNLIQLNSSNYNISYFAITAIPIIIIFTILFHFAFEFLGSPKILIPFFPINESIFEHLKLCVYPTIITWIIGAFSLAKKNEIDMSKWIISMTFSIITNLINVLSLYYIGTGAFNIHSMIFDISTIVIGTILGQILSVHIYNNISDKNKNVAYTYMILIILFFIMTYFSYNPKEIPLFLDSRTNSYGIK